MQNVWVLAGALLRPTGVAHFVACRYDHTARELVFFDDHAVHTAVCGSHVHVREFVPPPPHPPVPLLTSVHSLRFNDSGWKTQPTVHFRQLWRRYTSRNQSIAIVVSEHQRCGCASIVCFVCVFAVTGVFHVPHTLRCRWTLQRNSPPPPPPPPWPPPYNTTGWQHAHRPTHQQLTLRPCLWLQHHRCRTWWTLCGS